MKIDLETLSREQLVKLAMHGDQCFNLVITANNVLLARLADRADVSEPARTILNEWSAAMNDIAEASSAAVLDTVEVRRGNLN